MAKLLIQGDNKKYNDILELLATLYYGNNAYNIEPKDANKLYGVDSNRFINIMSYEQINSSHDYIIYTIDQFFEKFPYRVGDTVRYNTKNGNVGNIISMKWDDKNNIVEYIIAFSHGFKTLYAEELTFYQKENNVKPNMGEVSDGYHTFNELYEYRLLYNASFFNSLAEYNRDIETWITKYDVHKSKKHSDGKECFDGGWFIVMAELPTGQISNHYEMKDWDLFQIPEKEKANKWDGHTPQDVAKRMREFLTPKSKYPKTYEECCEALEYIPHTDEVIGYKWNIIESLQKLLICRDAYWKIAGEEMGLGKPWAPDWKDVKSRKYVIVVGERGKIIQGDTTTIACPFAFPTPEMRDYFYDNFKELIEKCKELL